MNKYYLHHHESQSVPLLASVATGWHYPTVHVCFLHNPTKWDPTALRTLSSHGFKLSYEFWPLPSGLRQHAHINAAVFTIITSEWTPYHVTAVSVIKHFNNLVPAKKERGKYELITGENGTNTVSTFHRHSFTNTHEQRYTVWTFLTWWQSSPQVSCSGSLDISPSREDRWSVGSSASSRCQECGPAPSTVYVLFSSLIWASKHLSFVQRPRKVKQSSRRRCPPLKPRSSSFWRRVGCRVLANADRR